MILTATTWIRTTSRSQMSTLDHAPTSFLNNRTSSVSPEDHCGVLASALCDLRYPGPWHFSPKTETARRRYLGCVVFPFILFPKFDERISFWRHLGSRGFQGQASCVHVVSLGVSSPVTFPRRGDYSSFGGRYQSHSFPIDGAEKEASEYKSLVLELQKHK